MSDAPLMLGVSGLRGIVGKSLTPEVAARFAEAFGGWLMKRAVNRPSATSGAKVVIGRDGANGPAIHEAAIRGLVAAGCEIVDLGIAMTASVGVMVDYHQAAGGIVVTASHNPQEWNGLKLLVRDAPFMAPPHVPADACAPSSAMAQEIIGHFHAGTGPAAKKLGSVSGFHQTLREHERLVIREPRSPYEAAVPGMDPAGRLEGLKGLKPRCVLDSVNGAGAKPGRSLLETLGCSVIAIGADASGVFSHVPEPVRENLTGLCETVKEQRAAVGFAQDPDADRLAIVDERGEYIGEEYTLALAAESLLSAPGRDAPAHRKPAVLVTNLSTSRMLDDIAAAHGARVVRTPVGEANVVEAMKREKAAGNDVVLGGEGNGGVIWPKVTYVRDSLSAMALVLSLMARTGKKVSELVAAIPAYAIEKRKVDLARKEDANPAIEKLAAHYGGGTPTIDLQDGIRIDWPDRRAWLHVRASNTEPIMRLIAEAPTASESRAILDEAARVIAR